MTVVLNASAANGTVVADAIGVAPGDASGGGTSQFETEPSYQQGVQSSGFRTSPDVSFEADPNTGVLVYDSYNPPSSSSPLPDPVLIGGTSLATPSWAGLIAIANQGRVAGGETTFDSGSNPTQTLQALYSMPASDFNDITSGYNGYTPAPAITKTPASEPQSRTTSLLAWLTSGSSRPLPASNRTRARRPAGPR